MWDLIVSVPDHCLSFYFSISFVFLFVGIFLLFLLCLSFFVHRQSQGIN